MILSRVIARPALAATSLTEFREAFAMNVPLPVATHAAALFFSEAPTNRLEASNVPRRVACATGATWQTWKLLTPATMLALMRAVTTLYVASRAATEPFRWVNTSSDPARRASSISVWQKWLERGMVVSVVRAFLTLLQLVRQVLEQNLLPLRDGLHLLVHPLAVQVIRVSLVFCGLDVMAFSS